MYYYTELQSFRCTNDRGNRPSRSGAIVGRRAAEGIRRGRAVSLWAFNRFLPWLKYVLLPWIAAFLTRQRPLESTAAFWSNCRKNGCRGDQEGENIIFVSFHCFLWLKYVLLHRIAAFSMHQRSQESTVAFLPVLLQHNKEYFPPHCSWTFFIYIHLK
jgi:hypothetical protein